MLYIVGTPIGNLEDLSIRQAKTILLAEIILTEDTRSTGMLLTRAEELFNLKRNSNVKLVSYYKDNEFEKLDYVLQLLQEDKNIVLISQAGMPLISDPGSLLVKQMIHHSLPFTVIPGPTAATTALLYTGFDLKRFVFFGFLPKKTNELTKTILKAKEVSLSLKETPIIFYESPNRINETLKLLDELVPSSQIVIGRELTKMFEEVSRGTPKELLSKTYKGEIVLIATFNLSLPK